MVLPSEGRTGLLRALEEEDTVSLLNKADLFGFLQLKSYSPVRPPTGHANITLLLNTHAYVCMYVSRYEYIHFKCVYSI